MKPILLLFLTFTIMGCSSDSETETVTPPVEFTGTWRQTSITPQGETAPIDMTDCELHPEAKKYVFDNNIANACYIKNACNNENQTNTNFNLIDGEVYITYANPELNDLQEKYSLTVYSGTKVGLKEIWNTVEGDIESGQYIVIEKQ